MPAAPKTLSKRVENAAIATGVVAATFGAVTWAATTNAQAAPAPVSSAAASPSLPPTVTVPAPSQTLAGPSEVPPAFAQAATVEAPQTAAAEPAAQPTAEKDPTHLESGWYTPVTKYSMTARFGVPGSWSSGYHTGLDLATNQGRTVRAATAGKIISSKYEGAYGNLVQLKIGPKTEIWMAHLDSVKVTKGDVIKAGDAIGTVGMTGRTSGPHLHLEVRVNGKAKNPEDFLWPTGKVLKRLK
jgi:murein DD-endopeptidase MepM/ murein hydrolase activator NlpD